MKLNRVIGLVLLILSVLGGFYSITTYADDTSKGFFGYTYQPPLTAHESVVMMIAFLSVIALLVGICLLCERK